jgi:hypothetical protein
MNRVRVDLAGHPARQVRRRRRRDVHDREQPRRPRQPGGQREAVAAWRLASGRPATTGSASSPNTTARNGSTSSARPSGPRGHHGDGEQQHRRAQRGPQLRVLRPGQPDEHDPGDDHRERGAQAHDRPADAGERPVPGSHGRHRRGRGPGHDGDRQPGRGGQVAAQHPVVHEVRDEGEQCGGRQGRGEGGETRCESRGRATPFGHSGQRRRPPATSSPAQPR